MPLFERNCLKCGMPFKRYRSQKEVSEGANPLFCSAKCRGNARRTQWGNLSEKEKIDHIRKIYYENVIVKDGCWGWNGFIDKDGYGILPLKSSKRPSCGTYIGTAHRASWFLKNGRIPKNKLICHNCPGEDNPLCSNPDHLYLGTHKENSEDMVKKGRSLKGVLNRKSKLCDDDIFKIKRLRKDGVSCKELSEKFKVTKCNIRFIEKNVIWKHIATE